MSARRSSGDAVPARWAERIGDDGLRALGEDPARLRAFAAERQLVDLLRAHPGTLGPDALVSLLQPLQPRLYSIASSQTEFPDEVHLTVQSH